MDCKNKDRHVEQFPEASKMFGYNIAIEKSENKYRQSKKALSSSKNIYKAIFENTGTATIVIEEDNTILLANGEFEILTGYIRDELEDKKKWTEFVYRKDDLERMKEYYRQRIINPLFSSKSYEFQFINQNGQLKDIIATANKIPGTKQNLMTWLDVTDRKQIEAALEESEKRLADTIDFLPDATFAVNTYGKVIAWNRAVEEMTGVKAADMLGKGNYEYTVTFYGMRKPMLIDLVFGHDEEIEKQYDFIKREGKVFLAETEVTVRGVHRALWGKAGPLYDNYGNVAGAIESMRDITDRRQARASLQKAHDELEMRVRERTAELMQVNRMLQLEISERKRAEVVMKESEEKYTQFFKTSRDCVFITSRDGRLIDLNDTAVELFGYSSREELLQKKIPYVYANQEERAKHARVITECGYTKEYPVDLCRRDGSIRHVLITAVARYDASGRTIGFQGTIRDITEKRQVEEEREKLILDLQKTISQVKTLNGLLPICASCKKIRDDEGYWNQIEEYLRDHSEVEFSHSLCPECAEKLYPEIYKEE
ncbi:MAG: PAS domain S-box protein [Syntrophaceae bacterium]|nr:PAS domain S-box protein [Syntrophaceae bacterium]